jgi:hypothetical protein
MPQRLSPFVEERIVAFALGHPGYGPRRIASELRPAALGRDRRQPQRRLALSVPARAPSGCRWSPATRPPRRPTPERQVEARRPGELVGIDCFFVGRLAATKGTVWQLTADPLSLHQG